MTPDLLTDKSFSAMLFDMDGTIINSIAAAEQVWSQWAKAHGKESHGLWADENDGGPLP